MRVYESTEALVGNTPLLHLANIEKSHCPGCTLLAKLESFNPAGSAKDRAALSMLNAAEAQGMPRRSSVIIEPTSGNTGIALAAYAVPRGYRVILVMPESMSLERRALIKAYGAEIELTPAALGMSGAISRAKAMAESIEGAFIPSQFTNPANPAAHYASTGPEIWRDTDGKVDVFVASVGTGGTITGAGRYLREQKSDITIVAAEPSSSPVLSGGKAGAHKIQGIGAGFVPQCLDTSVYSCVERVTDSEAYKMTRLIVSAEGLLVGISSGATLAAALSYAAANRLCGRTIVVLFTDGGEKYISSGVFD